ncbi:tripartite tricarboxylate transporter substrate binding protein [Roseomonas sp. NAR14]|uniref:Tripartite tricarboxylate transporter substrate binding protein n=2 Tax=Roseomonas acroporae TaxID=2937791 RepID=A0A9X2BSJ0_9PROT|nr:tripartite tricarboxylate transporter substrate binding protein [Roseomonas acroporae]
MLGSVALGLSLPALRRARADWPDRPITMIIAYAAGGGTDIVGRAVARAMEKRLGQSIVVLNRPGAGAEIGFAELARARPDGYTIGFINTPAVVTVPLERQARFALADFAPIANLVDDPGGFFVVPDSPYRTLADLVAAAKAQPGALTYGTTGVGSDDHLASLALQRQAGIELTHVPFAGSSQVRNALVGRQITIGSMNMGEGTFDARQGLVRALGQMGERRWQEAPDVPTFREQGFDVVEGSMRGLAAPAGTPAPVLERLAAAARQSLDDPDFQRVVAQQLLPMRFLGPEEFRRELVALRDHYTALWHQHPWRE